jgi:hypothetical protein
MRRTRLLLITLALATLLPATLAARPRPGGPSRGFRLLARAVGALTINRVYCGLSAQGSICVDTTGNGIGGGFWPKGTADQYVFASGFQIAGIIGPDANPEWVGDTTAAPFFDPAGAVFGGTEAVGLLYNSSDRDDLAEWPAAARVPDQPNEADELFHPLLRGRPSASQGDVWWLAWDGNPVVNSGRPHPLGVLLEERAMGWNFPAGNEDIVYLIFTIYNITSINPADYARVRPEIRETLLNKANEFQEKNNSHFRITLPERGYTITDVYVAFSADMDVADYSENYTSVNLPFALGYTYDHRFGKDVPGWTFDPGIFSAPFFPGTGFVGVKYLSSPRDASGREVGLTSFSAYVNGGSDAPFRDAGSAVQLYRYLTGRLDPLAGDGRCNTGDPAVTHICFINQGLADDMRFFQSTGPLTLAPGEFGSIAVAMIFAAPVQVESCTPPCDVRPGDPTVLGNASRMSNGVNLVDSLTGYAGFTDANGDGRVEQREFRVVPGSLLGKALVAQAVFDHQFLLPFAPAIPDFFLVPGDREVSVLWRPSASELTGDPFFETAQSPTVLPPGGGEAVPNPLYDPNYRRNDVEGYRIYRGRVDSPGSLQLIAQFDYVGTVISDFQGLVDPSPYCAPEIGITTSCAGVFDSAVVGVALTKSVDHPLVGPIVQVKLGGSRVRLSDNTALVLQADTALTGGGAGFPELRDTGVPFVYVDRAVRNDFRYFYSVTAFDLNSLTSGPSSLESARNTKAVTPAAQASNLVAETTVQVSLLGRGTVLDTASRLPGLDPGTGRFSGPFPPANDFGFAFAQTVGSVLSDSGSMSVTLDSLRLGSAYEHGVGQPGSPALYFFGARTAGSTTQLTLPVVQDQQAAPAADSGFVQAEPVDDALAGRYEGTGGFWLSARVDLGLAGNYYTSAWGRGCLNSAEGFAVEGTTGCEYNGPRWFAGPSPNANETKADPQGAHPAGAAGPGPMGDLGNAGELPGVATIQMPHAYLTVESGFRVIEGVLGGAQRAADFNLYWGEGGKIDSVIDVTHRLPLPFDSLQVGGGWGVLNQEATGGAGSFDQRSDVLTLMDFTCVEPLRSSAAVQATYGCTADGYQLSRVVVPGRIAIWDQNSLNARTATARPGPGFALYLAGNLTIFELQAGLPAANTVWSLRTYVGAIAGGRGTAGDRGPYRFHAVPRPLTAIGAELRLDYRAVNRLEQVAQSDLSRVHTVPDPYYVTSPFESATEAKVIQFVNLPADCLVRIYSSSGVLITILEHHSDKFGGSEKWNLFSRNNLVVASGVYFYHIEAGNARRVGRFTVVNYAP